MIRSDGRFKLFIIQTRSPDYRNGEWFSASMDHFNKRKYQNECMNASGKCWQETGIVGTYDKEAAINLCSKIKEDHPKEFFRVAMVLIEQSTIGVCEFN